MPELKRLTIKVFQPFNRKYSRNIVLAGNGRHFTEQGIEAVLERTAEDIEAKIPGHEYELVEVGPGEFNFVWRAERQESFAARQSVAS